jgi:pre-mRNA-processing factor 39
MSEGFPIAAEGAGAAPAGVGADYARYFDVVRNDPSDFTSWTLLLQACAKEEQFLAIATAYEAFLAEYPFCYAYWKKYADHVQRQASETALGPAPVIAVYERGVHAVAQSVDMWGYYCNFMSSLTLEMTTTEAIRAVYRRAVAAVGSAPLSNTSKTCQLWNGLLRFEMEVARDPRHLGEAYHLLLRTPFRGFGAFLLRYEEWASSPAADLDSPDGAVSDAALEQLKADVRAAAVAAGDSSNSDSSRGLLPGDFEELPRKARVLHCVKTLHQLAQREQATRDPYEAPLG